MMCIVQKMNESETDAAHAARENSSIEKRLIRWATYANACVAGLPTSDLAAWLAMWQAGVGPDAAALGHGAFDGPLMWLFRTALE